MSPVKPGNFYNHPPLGSGDINRLQELFPENPIWKAKTSQLGNVYYPTEEEASAFYQALRGYAEKNGISDEKYPTGNLTGSFPVESDLRSAFDDLIAFFEKELGINESSRYVARVKKDAPVEVPEEPPVIILPNDKKRQEQLKAKLEEYQGRIKSHQHPALQMGAICKKTVLERLLQDGQVNTRELSSEMSKTYGSDFDTDAFDNACGVIEDYCKTGGAHTIGGTGLSKVH